MINNFVSLTNIISHKLLLDHKQYQTKPSDAGAITNRIANHPRDIDIVELSKQVTSPNGKTWIPAYLEGGRTNKHWKSQSVFAIDFDSGMSFEHVLERLQGKGLDCTFAYETFSSTPDLQKFRVAFQLNQSIINSDYRYSIQKALISIFSLEVDKACKDASRMFYGGRELIYKNYGYCLDLALIDAMIEQNMFDEAVTQVAKTKNPKNYSQVLKRHRKKCEKSANPYIYTIANSKNHTQLDQVQADFKNMREDVKILDDLIAGKWLDYPTYRGLALNLIFIRGGVALYNKSLELMEKIHKDTVEFKQALKEKPNFLDRIKALPTVLKHYGYSPERLVNFSPYEEDWVYKNLLYANKKKGIVRLEPFQGKSVQEAREELKYYLGNALSASDNNIYVIKVPTGLGKTEMCTDLSKIVFAFPNHKLKDEVADRMKTAYKLTPSEDKLPQEVREKLKYFYSRGANCAVTRYLKEMAKNDLQVEQYRLDNFKCYDSVETVLTTHQKALYINWKHDTIIFDEDPLSTLLTTGTITVNDLVRLKTGIANTNDKNTLACLIDEITQGHAKTHRVMDKMFVDLKAIEDEVLSDTKYESKILHFFESKYFIVDPQDPATIHFISKHELPQDKKIVILSATANETIYRLLFGDRLSFYDVGDVEIVGLVIQDSTYSFSRTSLNKQLEYVVSKIMESGNNPTLTFVSYKECLKGFNINIVENVHFGKLTGHNTLKGQDINVVGTF